MTRYIYILKGKIIKVCEINDNLILIIDINYLQNIYTNNLIILY